MKQVLHYNVIFRPEPEGGFTASVPTLQGCVAYGESLKEAKKMVVDAIEGYIASLKKHKEPVPSDAENFFTSVDVKEAPVYA